VSIGGCNPGFAAAGQVARAAGPVSAEIHAVPFGLADADGVSERVQARTNAVNDKTSERCRRRDDISPSDAMPGCKEKTGTGIG
jgi:hypothetical protein